MIILVLIMIWLGRRRGMDYWNWVAGYIIISFINMVAVLTTKGSTLSILTSFICLLYLIAFFIWPYIASNEMKLALKENKDKYKKEDEDVDIAIQNKMKDWIVIKTYFDQIDSVEFHRDKNLLNEIGVKSIAKSTLGITTISVLPNQIDIACTALHIDAPIADEA